METILAHAHNLMYTLLALMPSDYQRDSLKALLGLFLEAQGNPLPHYSQTKSESALSRFLNQYTWSTRSLIRQVRKTALEQIKSHRFQSKKPILQVIIDLTTLEKRGNLRLLII